MSTTQEKLKPSGRQKATAEDALTVRMELLMSRRMRQELTQAAASEGTSAGALIRQAVRRYLLNLPAES